VRWPPRSDSANSRALRRLRRADRREGFRQQLDYRRAQRARAKAVIFQHPRRAQPRSAKAEMYKWRHLIENLFCKLKKFKRVAMRACARTKPTRASPQTSISPPR
jgi:hypothetical protein